MFRSLPTLRTSDTLVVFGVVVVAVSLTVTAPSSVLSTTVRAAADCHNIGVLFPRFDQPSRYSRLLTH